jgi:hypothetical protein
MGWIILNRWAMDGTILNEWIWHALVLARIWHALVLACPSFGRANFGSKPIRPYMLIVWLLVHDGTSCLFGWTQARPWGRARGAAALAPEP